MRAYRVPMRGTWSREGRRVATRLFFILMLIGLVFGAPVQTRAAGLIKDSGWINQAEYLIEVPADWNGTLLLFSHGYVQLTDPNPALDASDQVTHDYLLRKGYALAGSAYSTKGWAVADAIPDQLALLDYFTATYITPTRTVAWGGSLGGMITEGLVETAPNRFDGAMPMCGALAGGVASWNLSLDGAFVFKTLIAPDPNLELVHIPITNAMQNAGLARYWLEQAQNTPKGKAQIALTAAIAQVPGWYTTTLPAPVADDYLTQEESQYLWLFNTDLPYTFASRADLELKAGGNPSWNTDVNYHTMFAQSPYAAEVRALYAAAGRDLNADLDLLENAPRIAADPGALSYLTQHISYSGQISDPVLSLHTTGDGLLIPGQEAAYAAVVHTAGTEALLRQTFVNRAGHCSFTPGEIVAGLNTLIKRIDTGKWADRTEPDQMNKLAKRLGDEFNPPMTPAYITYTPAPFPRPYPAP